MNNIERYGVVALVFMIVTIVAVAVWDRDGEQTSEPDEDSARRTEEPRNRPDSPAAPRARNSQNNRPAPHASGARQNGRSLAGGGDNIVPGGPAARTVADSPESSASRPNNLAALREQELHKQRERELTRDRELEQQERLDDQRRAEQAKRVEQGRLAELTSERKAAAEKPLFHPVPDERRTHIVASGETLSEISQARLGTSKRWREILELNGIEDARKVRVGMELRLPAGRAAGPRARSATPPATTKGSADYVVRGGDSFWRIAERELGDGMRYKEIEVLNPKVDPAKLAVGQALRLPAERSPRRGALVADAASPAAPRVVR